MLKKLLVSAVLFAAPNVAAAATITAINDTGDAIAAVDIAKTLDLPGAWVGAPPLRVDNDDFARAAYLSPFGRGSDKTLGFWAVGLKYEEGGNPRKKVFDTTANSENPAALQLGSLTQSVSLLWGSPDADNRLDLFRGGVLVGSVGGNSFTPTGSGASFVTIMADDKSEFFDMLKFSTTGQTFEFSNVSTVAAVPLPASASLILTAIGGLAFFARRRKTAKAA